MPKTRALAFAFNRSTMLEHGPRGVDVAVRLGI